MAKSLTIQNLRQSIPKHYKFVENGLLPLITTKFFRNDFSSGFQGLLNIFTIPWASNARTKFVTCYNEDCSQMVLGKLVVAREFRISNDLDLG
jgi:hypothetical protein